MIVIGLLLTIFSRPVSAYYERMFRERGDERGKRLAEASTPRTYFLVGLGSLAWGLILWAQVLFSFWGVSSN